jgi:hypothetical protein
MDNRVILGCIMVLMLIPMSFAVTNAKDIKKLDMKTSLTTTTSIGVEWNHTFGGMLRDVAYSVIQTTDGGYALAGITESYGAGDSDFYLVKTDATGQMAWNRTFGGIAAETIESESLIQTVDEGFALVGWTNSYGAGNNDFYIVKTNTTGHLEWNQSYGGIEWEQAYSVIQTSDGGYAIAGITNYYGAGYTDFWLVKTDSNGLHDSFSSYL